MENRVIKFRAWDVVTKQMVYYGAFQFEQFPKQPLAPQDVRQRIFPFDGIESGEMVTKDCLNGWNLMQFTGFLDKNGKEVFEGDIVTASKFEGGRVVDFTLGSFGVADWHLWEIEGSIEIIGNRYENPELLK